MRWDKIFHYEVSSPVAEVEFPLDSTVYDTYDLVWRGGMIDIPGGIGADDILTFTFEPRDSGGTPLGGISEVPFDIAGGNADGGGDVNGVYSDARLAMMVTSAGYFAATPGVISVNTVNNASPGYGNGSATAVGFGGGYFSPPVNPAKLVLAATWYDASMLALGAAPNIIQGEWTLYGLRK
jgi:hypothetical protein